MVSRLINESAPRSARFLDVVVSLWALGWLFIDSFISPASSIAWGSAFGFVWDVVSGILTICHRMIYKKTQAVWRTLM